MPKKNLNSRARYIWKITINNHKIPQVQVKRFFQVKAIPICVVQSLSSGSAWVWWLTSHALQRPRQCQHRGHPGLDQPMRRFRDLPGGTAWDPNTVTRSTRWITTVSWWQYVPPVLAFSPVFFPFWFYGEKSASGALNRRRLRSINCMGCPRINLSRQPGWGWCTWPSAARLGSWETSDLSALHFFSNQQSKDESEFGYTPT